MGTTWVLHTETKGTGAQMVPLETLEKGSRSASPTPDFVAPKKPPLTRAPQEPEPRAPRRFKVVDVLTRQQLVEDASAKRTVEALRDTRSLVDVNVYVWEEERARWRPLTFEEQRTLMDLAAA